MESTIASPAFGSRPDPSESRTSTIWKGALNHHGLSPAWSVEPAGYHPSRHRAAEKAGQLQINALRHRLQPRYSSDVGTILHPAFPTRVLYGLLLSTLGASIGGCALLGAEPQSGPRSCPPSSFTKKLSKTDRTITILSYDEPKTQLNGAPLEKFSHTTIYYEVNGRTDEYAKRDGTSTHGGGTIGGGNVPALVMTFPPERFGEEPVVRICVTGTNSAGEGPPSH